MSARAEVDRERVRRLLRALYREEIRAGAYRVYRRRVAQGPVASMLHTFLRVQERIIGRLDGHLAELGVGRTGRRGPVRRGMSTVGGTLAGLTALRGLDAILRRIRGEEWRGSERYGEETDWDGWSEAERDTIDGHRCDQLYQAHWVELVQRDLREGRIPSAARPPRF